MNIATEVVFRPRAIRIVSIICAIALVTIFTVIGFLLGNTPTGVIFHTSDQVAMVVLGVLLAGLVLILCSPVVRADSAGIAVRNVFITRHYDWKDITGVAFPDGAAWARLELFDDEYLPLIAIQAVDRDYAVTAVRALRKFQRDAN